MSKMLQSERRSVQDILGSKGKEKLVCLTAYTAPMSELLDTHCDLLLVGDSVGMVLHGMKDTTQVSLDMMIMHGQAVMRGSQKALVVVDMPFGSYEESPEAAYRSALRIIRETGCQAVKLEFNKHAAETTAFLVERGIPVVGHIGLRPQAVKISGGFKVVGKTEESRTVELRCAKELEQAGAFAIVVEGVAADLAKQITDAIDVPTIGIGASAECDGQILVTDDMLGLFEWTPKFVRRYADLRSEINQALRHYADDVRSGAFPATAEMYFASGK